MFFYTDRLIVRPLWISNSSNDIQRILKITRDVRVNKFALWDAPETDLEVDIFMDKYNFHLVEDKVLGVVGFCRLNNVGNSGVYSIGYYLDPDFWGNGYATEVALGLMGYAFNELGARKVNAICDPRNVHSERVMKRCGMTYEGHIREDVLLSNGKRGDRLYYSMLLNEYLNLST
jgi:[ribosomal protein S5]-alanine N-acetyltransferase